MNPFDTDEATADRWIADQRFTLFGESLCPGGGDLCGGDEPHRLAVPPAWMVERAKPCEWCATLPKSLAGCSSCSNGQRRHPVTVPAMPGPGTYGPTTSGTLTVAHAVVEWGPLVAVDRPSGPQPGDGPMIYRYQSSGCDWLWLSPTDYQPIAVTGGIEDKLGQYAIGGRIEVAQ